MALPLIDLAPLLLFLIAAALCLAVVYVSKAFFGVTGTVLGKLPVIGGWIDATAHHIEQRITNVFGGLAAQMEARVAASWHSFARLVDHIGREIARHAGLIATIAALLTPFSAILDLYRGLHTARTLLHRLVHRIEGIGHDLITRTHGIEKGIGRDVLPRIRALEHEVDHVILRDVAALRARTKTLEREYERLYKWMRSHPWTLVTSAFVGAVAIALSRLGLDWIKCNTAKSVFRKRGCNLWSDLDKLLGALAEVALVTNICQVIPWLEEGFSLVAAPLVSTLTAIGAGLCGTNSAPPELLPVTTLHIPAAPDATLYLP